MSLFDEGITKIKPEKRDEIRKLFIKAQNFLKHADRDPDANLEFFPDATKFYLLDATRLLLSLTRRDVPETAALVGFFVAKYPDGLISTKCRNYRK